MNSVRFPSFPILEAVLAPRDSDLALALLYQAGLTTVITTRAKTTCRLQAQIPARVRPTRVLRLLRDIERRLGLRKVFFEVRIRQIPRTGWADRYEKFLSPFPLLAANSVETKSPLIIDPRGRRPRKPKANTLYIKASLAFGTGTHASTQLAAEFLRRVLDETERASVLDMGCGTGILAMCAARWGASSVVAVDNDPLALEVSRNNFSYNRIRGVTLFQDLKAVRSRFQIIVANITAPALSDLHDALLRRLARGGSLILSGLIYRDVPPLLHRFRDLQFQGRKSRKGWAALLFKKR